MKFLHPSLQKLKLSPVLCMNFCLFTNPTMLSLFISMPGFPAKVSFLFLIFLYLETPTAATIILINILPSTLSYVSYKCYLKKSFQSLIK